MDLSLPFIGLIGGAIFVFLVIIVLFWMMSLRVVVPTNMVHIVQSSKKSADYGVGRATGNTYYKWPSWIPVIGVIVSEFPESIFPIRIKEYLGYDSGRIPFKLDATAFFRVLDAPKAAQRVNSFSELNAQLEEVVRGAIRAVLAKDQLEKIMEDRSGLGAKFTEEVNKGLEQWGVTLVRNIEFMDIRDADGSVVIENIMAKEQSRIDQESRVAVATNRQLAETREIEVSRDVALRQQEAEQQVGIRTAEKEQAVGIADEQSEQQVLEQKQATAERLMAVKKVEEVRAAEIAREVAEVVAAQDQRVTIIAAEARRDQTTIVAEGDLQAAKKNAEAITVEGQAKGAAETALLMAPVNSQLELSKGLGQNQEYLAYLVRVREVEASEAVGKEAAGALKAADLKVIANSGDVNSGVNSLLDMFSAKGGTQLGAMVEAFTQTEQGQKILGTITDKGAATPPKGPRTK